MPDLRVRTAYLVYQDHLVLQEMQELKGLKDHKDLVVNKAPLDHLEHLVVSAQQVLRDPGVIQASPERTVAQGTREAQDLRGSVVPQVTTVSQGHQGSLEPRVCLEHREPLEILDHQDSLEWQDQVVLQVLQETQDHLVCQVYQDQWDL